MKFQDHIFQSGPAIQLTLENKQKFKKLHLNQSKKVFVVGSGSSYSNAIYFRELFQRYFSISVIVKTPYSFVKGSKVSPGDILIHITQEGKRNDNICPLRFGKKNKMQNILFMSKQTSLTSLADEIYYFTPETEKILVASMSYMSANALILKYISSQTYHHICKKINYSTSTIIKAVDKALEKKYVLSDAPNIFLYSGFGEVAALEAALKINECLMKDAESYELKHFSHGKHFNTWNKNRIFNILSLKRDRKLIKLYQGTIIEKRHLLNIMESSLSEELSVFDHGAMVLTYVAQLMNKKKITLQNIKVRNKIRKPHGFEY